MKKLSGILFDFNGTLFFDSRMHMDAFIRVFPRFGAPVPTDEYMINNVFGRTNAQIYYENCNPNGTPDECEAFRVAKEQAYYDLCLSMPEKCKLVSGAAELLDYIKANNIPYCLATGSGREEVEFYIEHLGLSRWFSWDNIVYTDGTFRGKPEPDCYILAAERLSLTPENCVVFEDGSSGIAAANAAKAGAVIAVYEDGIPSPVTGDLKVSEIHHSLADWRDILERYGLRKDG